MERQCARCGQDNETNTELAIGLCSDCYPKVAGEADACPSCGCPLVSRVQRPSVNGGWWWVIEPHVSQDVHYCPEHGCDLEAEFHLALKEKHR